MTNITTLFSNSVLNEDMLKKLNVELTIENNPYAIPLGQLFWMGARKNPKRNFLFVSKVLGKHIPVSPLVPRVTGALLSDTLLKELGLESPIDGNFLSNALTQQSLLREAIQHIEEIKVSLEKKTLVIGFAETATGLGHAVYDVFGSNVSYIHTTRERLVDLESVFNFEEEHSHATSHLCYAREENYFEQFEQIVLVDDEMSTGKTSLNLIRALDKNYPNKEYAVVSILDWRKPFEVENYRKAEKELGISIKEALLVKGTIKYQNTPIEIKPPVYQKVRNNQLEVETVKVEVSKENYLTYKNKGEDNSLRDKGYYLYTGRFGMDNKENYVLKSEMKKMASILKAKRQYSKTLCVGYGEHMHIPNLIASELGEDVYSYATTRSPIYYSDKEDYPVKNAISFTHPEDNDVTYFLYNIIPNSFEEVFFLLERDVEEAFKKEITEKLQSLGVKHVVFAPLKGEK